MDGGCFCCIKLKTGRWSEGGADPISVPWSAESGTDDNLQTLVSSFTSATVLRPRDARRRELTAMALDGVPGARTNRGADGGQDAALLPRVGVHGKGRLTSIMSD
jgi:hypothetical protein